MSERAFPDGTDVRHKSGGPKMTVADYGKFGMAATRETYKCRWFDKDGKLTEATFAEAELKPWVGAQPVRSRWG